MRNFIAAVSLAAFANVLAYAGETYAPPEADNTERAVPDVAQTEQTVPDVAQIEQIEETQSAASGESAPSDDENAAADEDSESPAEIDQ
jgi:hypothetical protein